MKKGVFWCVGHKSDALRLIIVSAECSATGESDPSVVYSSKSGDNFNHKIEWQKLLRSVTGGFPYNYYPRGRVEIKSGKGVVYLNPDINTPAVVGKIRELFELDGLESVTFKSDGSAHYRYTCT